MAKSIKLTKRVKRGNEMIDKPVYFIAENIIHFEQMQYEGREYTEIVCNGSTESRPQLHNVVESAVIIDAFINGK